MPNGRPSGAAFRLRIDERCLSVNWLEFFDASSLDESVAMVQADLSNALELGASAGLAELNVGKAKLAIKAVTRQRPTITHEPTRRIKSHSHMCGFKHAEFAVASALAKVVSQTFKIVQE